MRILRLSFKNIASFRSDKLLTIDFTSSPLSNHSLFLITGSTGAGKSTLLDAITIALYNKYSREKSTNNIISSLATNAIIELEYEKDGTEYRNVWKLNRSRDKIDGALQQSEMQLSLVSTNEILSSKKTEVIQKTTEILGLDFEQFTKTIILPQGDFANFLHAKDDVKIELFEKITDTKKYREFSQFVFQRNKDEEQKLSKIYDAIGNVEPMNEVDEKNLSNEINKLSDEILIRKENINDITTKLQHLKHINEISELLEQIESQLSELSNQKERIDTLESSLLKAENANEILHLITSIKNQTELLKNKNEELNSTQQKKSELEDEITKIQKEFDTISTTFLNQKNTVASLFESLSPYTEITNSINTIHDTIVRKELELAKSHEELNQNNKQIELLTKTISQNTTEKQQIEEYMTLHSFLDDAPTHIERLKSLQNDLHNLNSHQIEISTAIEHYSQEIIEKSKEVIEYETKLSEHRTRKLPQTEYSDKTTFSNELLEKFSKLYSEVQTINNSINTSIATQTEIEKQIQQSSIEQETILSDFQLLNSEYEVVTKEISSLQLEMKLLSFRAELIDGQPCPLCGSLDHSLDTMSHTTSEDVLNTIESLELKKDSLQRKLSELQKNLNINEQLQQQRLGAIEQNKSEILLLKNELQTKSLELKECGFSQNDDTFLLIQNEITAREHNKIIQIQIESDENILSRDRKEIVKLNEKIAESKLQLEKKSTEYADRLNEIVKIKGFYPFSQELQTEAFIEHIDKALQEYKSKKEFLSKLHQDIAVYNSQLETIIGSNSKLTGQISELQHSSVETKQRLEETMQKKSALFGETNIEEEHKSAHQLLQSLHSNLQSIEKQLQNKKETNAKLIAQSTKINDEIIHYINPRIDELTQQKYKLMQQYNFSNEEDIISSKMEKELFENNKNLVQEFKQKFTNLEYDKYQKRAELELSLQTKPNENKDELITSLETIETNHQELLEELGAKKLLFEQNEEKKELYTKHKSQYELQKTITNRWNKLNTFIGSNDGKKYQRMVQRITMARLIEYTNVHLKEFSHRYSLSLFSSDNDSTNQSLDLLIQDQDNFGKLRNVSTLSGGETFLVSLSMALGIASMISSTTEVESLFLDEGFGTLDYQTLETVMLSLENLQQRGRKIGIISHVEQLKERISTQIVVQPIGNGSSTVFVREQ